MSSRRTQRVGQDPATKVVEPRTWTLSPVGRGRAPARIPLHLPRAHPDAPWLPTPPGHRHAVTSNVRSSPECALTCRWAAGQPCPIPPANAPSLAVTTDTTERPDAAHRCVRGCAALFVGFLAIDSYL